jgi:hypothetical protein
MLITDAIGDKQQTQEDLDLLSHEIRAMMGNMDATQGRGVKVPDE